MKKNNQIWAFIPARSGSKGVTNKNIKQLDGHPLLAWSIKACQKSRRIDRIFVSTDSSKYAKIAKQYGAEVPYLRSKSISGDNSSDLEWFKELIKKLKMNEIIPKLFAHVRPTTPLRDPKIIDTAVNLLIKNKSATSLRSVHEMSETAYKCFEINKNEFLQPLGGINVSKKKSNVSRQLLPKTYAANGYIDIIKYDTIFKKNDIHGDKILSMITPHISEIDTVDDFEYIKYQSKKLKKIKKNLFN